eukprot:6214458-Pleurochrysis_carterae.AAC.10
MCERELSATTDSAGAAVPQRAESAWREGAGPTVAARSQVSCSPLPLAPSPLPKIRPLLGMIQGLRSPPSLTKTGDLGSDRRRRGRWMLWLEQMARAGNQLPPWVDARDIERGRCAAVRCRCARRPEETRAREAREAPSRGAPRHYWPKWAERSREARAAWTGMGALGLARPGAGAGPAQAPPRALV